jgi:hypothetical protein
MVISRCCQAEGHSGTHSTVPKARQQRGELQCFGDAQALISHTSLAKMRRSTAVGKSHRPLKVSQVPTPTCTSSPRKLKDSGGDWNTCDW